MKETPIKANSRKAMKYRGVECLNCGHPLDLSDRFCPYCGQINTTKRLSLKDFIGEFVLSVFTYDSKFRFTVKDLLFKPGTITRHYVSGERLKYANPFRFFLSASILYFILIGIADFISGDENFDLQGGPVTINTEGLDEDMEEIKNDISTIKNYDTSDSLETNIEKKINERVNNALSKTKDRDSVAKKKSSYTYVPEDSLSNDGYVNSIFKKGYFFYEFYEETEITDPKLAIDSLNYTTSRTNLWLYSKMDTVDRVKSNPARFARYMASKTPFFLFFFSPLFALFFWLIYSKKKFNYMEHLVFIFHIFSWVFLVLLIALLPDKLIFKEDYIAGILLLLVGPFYFYKALRNFYKQKRAVTFIKFVFLNFVFWIGTSLFAIIFFAITAIFF